MVSDQAFTYRSLKKDYRLWITTRPVTLYEKAGLIKKWLETPEASAHKWEKVWYDKVKSKRTGEFNQADELIKRDMVPPDWKPPHVDWKR